MDHEGARQASSRSGPKQDRSVRPRPSSGRAGFPIVLACFLILSFLVFNQNEEDAFIYFRLVDNIVDGHGYVFNRGGERVEAGSSPLWMLLLVLLWSVPLERIILAKLLGLTLGCVALWLVYRLCELQIRDPVARLAPPLLTAVSTPFLMWSGRGLETPLVVALVLWLVLCCVDPRRFRWWPAPAGLLVLARPEGFFFLLGLLPFFAFHRERWRTIAFGLLGVAAVTTLLLGSRFLYFHELVPQPFYLKLDSGVALGLRQIHDQLSGSHVYLFGVPLLLASGRPRFWTRERIVIAGFVLTIATWCALAGDYMPYTRHLIPALPLLFVLLVAALAEWVEGRPHAVRALAQGYLLVFLVTTLFFSQSVTYFSAGRENPIRRHLGAFATDPARHAREIATKIVSPSTPGQLDEALNFYATLGTNRDVLIGEFLRRNFPADTLVIYDQMGQTPFHAGADMGFVDSWGLTDRTVSLVDFHLRKRGDVLLRAYDAAITRAVALAFGEQRPIVTTGSALDYLFSLEADLILIHRYTATIPRRLTGLLWRDPRLERDYELRYALVPEVERQLGITQVLVYARKGQARADHVDVPAGLVVVPAVSPEGDA
jgi:hypothetical protein